MESWNRGIKNRRCGHNLSPLLENMTLPFPTKGVKLSALMKIVEGNNGKIFDCPVNHFNLQEGAALEKFEDFTTTDVCELIIKPIVRNEKCSYCEYL